VGKSESRQGRVCSHAFQARMTMVAREPELCVLTSNVTARTTTELTPPAPVMPSGVTPKA